jgi:hypothetical protein
MHVQSPLQSPHLESGSTTGTSANHTSLATHISIKYTALVANAQAVCRALRIGLAMRVSCPQDSGIAAPPLIGSV